MNDIEFIAACRRLIGLSYAACDCIGVIRNALHIRCQGTNWLWRSTLNSPKYRYLAECTRNKAEVVWREGDLAFKIRDTVPKGYATGPDVYHVGVIARNNDGLLTVIHSSPSTGVREELFNYAAWDGWGRLSENLVKWQPD